MFEGSARNTPASGKQDGERHGVTVPLGYDARVEGERVSLVMMRYGTGGTPWTIVIDKHGVVRFSAFSPGADTYGEFTRFVDELRKERVRAPSSGPEDGGDER